MIAWQAQILEMATVQMVGLQNLLIVHALLLQGDLKGAYIKCQEDPTMPPLFPINKDKPMCTLDQALSGVEPQKDSQLPSEKTMTKTQEGAMKRQVIEAWRNMKAKKYGINEALGIQEPCNCYRYYGLPCLQKKSGGGKIEIHQDQQTEVYKKRKTTSPEPMLSVEPNLCSASQPPLVPNSHQTHSYLEELDAPSATLAMPKLCLDGWTISYTELRTSSSKK